MTICCEVNNAHSFFAVFLVFNPTFQRLVKAWQREVSITCSGKGFSDGDKHDGPRLVCKVLRTIDIAGGVGWSPLCPPSSRANPSACRGTRQAISSRLWAIGALLGPH